jgi:hypothetical protein
MRLTTDLTEFRREVERERRRDAQNAVRVLNLVGKRTVEYLQSEIGVDAPPAHTSRAKWDRRKAGRPAHPGGWADRSGRLSDGYGYRIVITPAGPGLELYNDAAHAHLVEAMDGFFVLTGVTESGGPVDRALRLAIREVAPHWKIAA